MQPPAIPAESETVAVHCTGLGCRHSAVIATTRFPPGASGPPMARRLVCPACGARNPQVMRDMLAHYARIHAEAGFMAPLPVRYRVIGRDVPRPDRRR